MQRRQNNPGYSKSFLVKEMGGRREKFLSPNGVGGVGGGRGGIWGRGAFFVTQI